MPGKHTELAFEDAIEHSLVTEGGWLRGEAHECKPDLALRPADLFAFIAATQPRLWAELHRQHGDNTEANVIDALVKALETRGTLDVLRHGFKFYGQSIQCAAFKPAHGLNPDTLLQYQHNRLVVTRQVRLAADTKQSIDLLLSLNGLPIVTAELKSPLTGQTVHHAIAQYRQRDPKQRLFHFKRRALVHFAVDPDLVFMTTRLDGASTVFLPFNRGHQHGAGNPEHPGGYRTSYLWQEVWQRDSFLDIVGRFIHLVKEERIRDGKKVQEEKIVFPRYHQLDAVRMLQRRARAEGSGHSYLIQHSAGSGKSNSIAWLAHHLASLHDPADRKVFDSVIVITDRRVLDKQLQDNIYQFEHKQGVVVRIDEDSGQLAQALSTGALIVITTLQKFPFVLEKITYLPERRYAVILDEAHSSQSGDAALKMKQVLAAPVTLEQAEAEDQTAEPEDAQDEVERALQAVLRARGRQPNLSFFAFTATPKPKTLELFGEADAEGKPNPHHLYSMRQAIEEEFILDVLASYTTYKTYYRLVKASLDDPLVPKRETTRQLARFMSLHPYNIAQKTQIIIEHFRTHVRHRIGGRAKAMVVTASRLHAVRYKRAFEGYLKERGYADIGVLVAFSGTVEDPETGLPYTEPGMNLGRDGKPISEAKLPGAFDGDHYQVLLVANKYQTGFDQPYLHTMYVDKRLSGLQAVQTLSRLNRTCPGKEDTFVLDFVNEAEEIRRSFQPYYEQTTIAESADPQQLYELSHTLEEAQVFWRSEVEAFCQVFFAPRKNQSVHDQAEMHRHLNPGIDRFKAKTQEEQEAFRNALGAFVRLYAFLAQVMPFADTDLEKLYTFARTFETKLPQDPKKAPLRLDGEVRLKYYRLDKVHEGAIALTAGEPGVLYGPTAVGTRKAKEEETPLSRIIDILNEHFGTAFTAADQLLFDQFIESAKEDPAVIQQAQANALDNFALAMRTKVEALMLDRMDQNQEIVSRYLNDPQFKGIAFNLLMQRIYEEVRAESLRSNGNASHERTNGGRAAAYGRLTVVAGLADRRSWLVLLKPPPADARESKRPWGARLRAREQWFARGFLDRLSKRFTVFDVGAVQRPLRDPAREARAQVTVCRLHGIGAVLVSGAEPVFAFLDEDAEIDVVLQGDEAIAEAPNPEQCGDLGLQRDWHRGSVGAAEAHAAGVTGRGVLIGVVDSGIDIAHHEFAGCDVQFERFGSLGYRDNLDAYGDEITVVADDPSGHGTHVCGIAAGRTLGVAPGAALAVAQVVKGGLYTATQIAAGMEWLLALPRDGDDLGVDLINLSLGAVTKRRGFTALFKAVITQCVEANKPVIAAIGNYGPNTHISPANYKQVVGVGAIDHHDQYWSKSSRGAVPEEGDILKPDFVAPGVAVCSALAGTQDYRWLSGTSMATPVTTGVAALLLQAGHGADLHRQLSQRAAQLHSGNESMKKIRF